MSACSLGFFVFEFCQILKQKIPRLLRRSGNETGDMIKPSRTSIFLLIFIGLLSPHSRRFRGRWNKILVGMVVKLNVGEFEEEVREVVSGWLRKYFTGVVQGVSGKRIFLESFQDCCEKYLTPNKLTVAKLQKIPVNKETKVLMISMIPERTIYLEKGFYHDVYIMHICI